MTHMLKSNPYTITEIVRHTQLYNWRSHIIHWNNPTDNAKLLKTHLNNIDSELLYIIENHRYKKITHPVANDNRLDYSEYKDCLEVFSHPISNVQIDKDLNISYSCHKHKTHTIDKCLVYASHPDVIQWVKNNDSCDLEIINIPSTHKIMIRDTEDDDDEGFEYILIPKEIKIVFL